MTRLPDDWQQLPVTSLFHRSPVGRKYDQWSVQPEGRVPVLDQSPDGVFGYHNDEPGIQASPIDPIITFSNHRCYVRYITHPFSVIQNVFPLKCKPGVHPRFFFYAILGRTPITEYKGHWPEFKLLQVRLPPLPEQRRIAAVLGALDDKIELNRKMNKTLEEMAQAIFKSWFIDFDGHTDLVDSELGPIPRGWEVYTLGDLISLCETGSRPKGGVKGILDGVPSIGAESIVGIGVFDYSKTKYIPRSFFERMKKGHLGNRDVLVYKDGGKPGDFRPHVSMFGDGFPYNEAAINSHVYRLRAGEQMSQEFLYWWLSSEPMMKTMRRLGTGAAIPGIPRRNLVSIPVLLPPSAEMDRFTAIAIHIASRVFCNSKQSRVLAELRDTLLPKLISGEIRIPEAEDIVEDQIS